MAKRLSKVTLPPRVFKRRRNSYALIGGLLNRQKLVGIIGRGPEGRVNKCNQIKEAEAVRKRGQEVQIGLIHQQII